MNSRVLVGAFLLTLTGQGATRPGAIAGWWHGTSTCVKATWNAACHDEVVVYEFVPTSPDSSRLIMHAFKIVAGQREPMGDLPVVFAPATREWLGDFANGRVDIRWGFRVRGDSLAGELLIRPEMRVGRHVVAVRGAP